MAKCRRKISIDRMCEVRVTNRSIGDVFSVCLFVFSKFLAAKIDRLTTETHRYMKFNRETGTFELHNCM